MPQDGAKREVTFLADDLRLLLDSECIETDPAILFAHTIDGLLPSLVVRPQAIEDVATIVGWAGRQGLAVSPWGGGTKQGIGRPLRSLDVVLKTDALDRIVEADIGNLTAEVQAGVTLGNLGAAMAKERQFFALDPLDGEEATLGGIIATNASGPRRLLYRTARDQVLGMHVVLPDGSVIRTGGKTVKDVAGYNLTKPLIGSWGTLGVIVGAIVRFLPVPEESVSIIVRFADVLKAAAMAMKVRSSFLLPAAMEMISDNAWQHENIGNPTPKEAYLLFGIEAHREAVARMRRDLEAMAHELGAADFAVQAAAESAALWTRRRALGGELMQAPGAVRAKASIPISALGTMLAGAIRAMDQAGIAIAFGAHAGNGSAQIYLRPAGSAAEQETVYAFRTLRAHAESLGGFLVVEVAPLGVKQAIDALPPRDDYVVMKTVREALNPRQTLNPGKLV
ncbi:MAG: FAD-binding oxidoreductase [Chloroflexota bacterium]